MTQSDALLPVVEELDSGAQQSRSGPTLRRRTVLVLVISLLLLGAVLGVFLVYPHKRRHAVQLPAPIDHPTGRPVVAGRRLAAYTCYQASGVTCGAGAYSLYPYVGCCNAASGGMCFATDYDGHCPVRCTSSAYPYIACCSGYTYQDTCPNTVPPAPPPAPRTTPAPPSNSPPNSPNPTPTESTSKPNFWAIVGGVLAGIAVLAGAGLGTRALINGNCRDISINFHCFTCCHGSGGKG